MAQTLYDYYTGQGKALPSLQERAKTFEAQGLGSAGTYTGTVQQNTALLGKLSTPSTPTASQQGLDILRNTNPALASQVSGALAIPSPTVPTTISSTNLQNPTNPVVVPPYTSPPTPVPDLSQLIKDYNTPSAAETTAQNDQNTLLNSIKDLLDTQGTESARTAELQAQAGIPDLSKNLNEINAQIRGINSEAFSQSQDQLGRNATAFNIYGRQAQIERQKSAQTFGLAAASAALQDNIALATQNVDNAIKAEFDPLESQINYQKLLLDMNKDKLTAAQKSKADALNLILDERSRLLNEQKSEKESVYNIMTQAAQSGADALTLNKIASSASIGEAILNAGDSLGADFIQKVKQQKFENDLKLQQLEYQKIADAADAAGNSNTAGIASDLTSILGSGKIGAGTKTAISSILGVVYATEDLAKARPEGKFTGYYPASGVVDFLTPSSLKKTSTIENEGYFDAINLKVQQWASGASLTKAQIEQVDRFTPKKTDTDRIIQTKLNNLVNFMNQQIKASLATEGIVYDPEKVDLFNKNENLADIFGIKPIDFTATTNVTKI